MPLHLLWIYAKELELTGNAARSVPLVLHVRSESRTRTGSTTRTWSWTPTGSRTRTRSWTPTGSLRTGLWSISPYRPWRGRVAFTILYHMKNSFVVKKALLLIQKNPFLERKAHFEIKKIENTLRFQLFFDKLSDFCLFWKLIKSVKKHYVLPPNLHLKKA